MAVWRVTNQVERKVLGPSGGIGEVVEVQFVTENGTTGTVNVPKSVYNVDEVKRRIDEYVSHIGAVEGLTG